MPNSDVVTLVATWPQAVVAVVLILSVSVGPSLAAWVQAKRSATTVNEAHKTLTTNNGGSTVKDQLDRIEKTQADAGETAATQGKVLTELVGTLGEVVDRMTAIEDLVTKPEKDAP